MQKKTIKHFRVFAVFLLVLSLFTPFKIFASENNHEILSRYAEITEDTALYITDENEKVAVGLLKAGQVIGVQDEQEDYGVIYYGDELAYVEKNHFMYIDEVEVDTESWFSGDFLSFIGEGYVHTSAYLVMKPEVDAEVMGELFEHASVAIIAEINNFYQALIGHRLVFIPKEAVSVISEEGWEVPSDQPLQVEVESGKSLEQDEGVSEQGSPLSDEPSEINEEASQEGASPSTDEELKSKDGSVEEKQSEESAEGNVTITNYLDPIPSSVKYFKVIEDETIIYDNSSGKLVPVGILHKDQVFPRIRDYGRWHEIEYGRGKGYVWEASTVAATGEDLKNVNFNYNHSSFSVTMDKNVIVYDNTSKSLVPYATIFQGQTYPVVSDYGPNWYKVGLSNRIGYIKKSEVSRSFLPEDKYFKVIEDHLTIYDNSSGKLVPVGSLEKGQIYPRIRDYGRWHEIAFGNGKAYVFEPSTVPASGNELQNLNFNYRNSNVQVTLKNNTVVYDNTSGSLVPYAVINSNVTYPIIGDFGPNWYKIGLANRIGYIKKSDSIPVFTSSDRYFKVTEDKLPVYDNSTGSLVPIGYLKKGYVFKRLRDYGNWHEISFGSKKGYVWERSTIPAAPTSYLKDKSSSRVFFKAKNDTIIYNGISGDRQPVAVMKQGHEFSIVKDYNAAWFEVNVAGTIGFVSKHEVNIRYQSVVNPRQTYSYNDLANDIQTLKVMYPDLIQTSIIGKSVDGRNLYAFKLGKGSTEVFFNGSHHAREHISTNLIMEMADQYAYHYMLNKNFDGFDVRSVLDKTSIWFVPMVNPDGVTLVQEGHNSAKNPYAVLKMNGFNYDFSSWKANIRGVDLNRQYPADWNYIRHNTGVPSPDNYKGPYPLSEPEAKAVYNFTNSHAFKVTVAYHTAGEIIFWNYKQSGTAYTRDLNLAKKLSTETGYSLIAPETYPSGGGYKDWFIQEKKRPGFTIELAPYPGPRPVSISQFDDIWRRNHSIGLIVAQEALYVQ